MLHTTIFTFSNKLFLRVLILILVLMLGGKLCIAQGTITGIIVYANTTLTPIHDSTMVRLYQGTTLIMEIPIDTNGSFTFNSVTPGNYTVKALVNKQPGGFNAKDSYLVLRHFVGYTPQLTGIYLVAADVNGSGGIPASADYLGIIRRFTHKINTFYNPLNPNTLLDWVSQPVSVTVTPGNTQTITVKVLCTGDVDGSFIPN